jgi:hypothetical protein
MPVRTWLAHIWMFGAALSIGSAGSPARSRRVMTLRHLGLMIFPPPHSVPGILCTAMAAAVMFALAAGKGRAGRALGDPVLGTEGRVTMVDGILATAVLLGLILNAALGWWWADPATGYVLVFYAAPRGPGNLLRRSPRTSWEAVLAGRVAAHPEGTGAACSADVRQGWPHLALAWSAPAGACFATEVAL